MSAIIATPRHDYTATSKLDGADVAVNDVKTHALYTVDDLLFNRSRTIPDTPLVAYPASSRGRADYVHYTAQDLDRFADHSASKYASMGLVPENHGPDAEVVGLLAPSNLDYVASIFALHRLGFAVLLLSNRLATEAYVSLLHKTNCRRIVSSENLNKQVMAIQSETEVTRYPVHSQTEYNLKDPLIPRYPRQQGNRSSSNRIAFIIHSSGSTGLPKPIFQTQAACLMNYSSSFGYRAFLTLPLYHNHGLSSFFRAVYSGKEIALFNANLPLSGPNLIEAMRAVNPECFYGVPYALKLLAETESGVEVLRKCKLVLFGGSSCPDDLGDRLVEAGVYLVGHYGATEIGQLMTSFRPIEDKAWNYVRPLPASAPYMLMTSRGPNTFECVVLDGLPSKVVSNSDDPPNSFRTSDLFSPHPTIPNAWKYLGRLDDRVTLVNGEKVLPIPYEHQIRENELVREACVFGVGRAFPGLIIILSEKASGLSKAQVLDSLWPVVQAANARVEGFSQISRQMIEVLDVGVEYPCTDKGTMIRAAFYRKFEKLVDSIYLRFESPADVNDGSRLQLNCQELKLYLHNLFVQNLGFEQIDDTTDFFEAGVDSLQALSVRGIMMRELDLGSNTLGQNVVFEYPNISALATHLFSVRTGTETVETDEIETMRELIEKYSTFESHIPGACLVDGETIILTGVTGSLGAHVLAQLLAQDHVKAVYCLVRASTQAEAQSRVLSTLSSKQLDSELHLEKIHCLPSDLSRDDLGLDVSTLDTLRKTLTTIIHCAWAVNFNLGVKSFEQHHVKGTFNLLNLCLGVSTTQPAKLFFCSSISAAAGTPLPAIIQETYIDDLSHAQNMGYARSKLVTETIVKAAAEQTGVTANVLRVGQIVGDTKLGLWNSTEAISLMIRSASIIGALPALEETPSWLPVDVVARSVLELANLDTDTVKNEDEDTSIVFHVQNSHLFHWTNELLPALRNAGLTFETVSQREWIRRLRDSESDPQKNPTIKLLDFFAEKYDNDNPGRKGLVFVTEKTGERSKAIGHGYDIIGSGIVKKIVDSWRQEW
ncbi:acetyl-CoA synthetase-like protein [Mollisia scopiformis]|uniref:Acetyl-CoA synthetase-like protein n=1 Tax=Mollisia scopiformis TaxID=149040 RepID=A0A194XDW7_MOLSC|nr:acetyl-CoA synthetase-like protein [Mollisia scopiformis]KUJ18380.1 acetyl-CoA synthetase-like protein [Mollisia scopiformis]